MHSIASKLFAIANFGSVFYQTFTNVFYLFHVFYVFNVFFIFMWTFITSWFWRPKGKLCDSILPSITNIQRMLSASETSQFNLFNSSQRKSQWKASLKRWVLSPARNWLRLMDGELYSVVLSRLRSTYNSCSLLRWFGYCYRACVTETVPGKHARTLSRTDDPKT